MNFSKKIILIAVIFGSFAGLWAKKKPDWVISRPINPNYYIGIGVAEKSKDNLDYIQIAKDNALKNLASEININVSGDVISKVIEKSGISQDEIKSEIRTSTTADLEGYEVVGTYEDKNSYWIYYRLSKELYRKNKREKINKAIALSLDMFSKAKENEKNGDINKAILLYLESLKPLEKFIAEPLKTEFNGKEIYLNNEIYSAVQNILSEIRFIPLDEKIDAKIGRAAEKPLKIRAELKTVSKAQKISNLPLVFSFIKGEGDLLKKARTNADGIGQTEISKITSSDNLQIVKTELDLSEFGSDDSVSFLYRDILKSFPIPSTKFIISVSGLSFYVESSETIFGEKTKTLHIEPKLKEMLSEKGFSFVKSPSGADLMMTIKAVTEKGTKVYNMCSAFANVTVSMVDLSSGKEIYKNSYGKIKGIDIDFEKAARKALDESASKITKEILPVLKSKI